MMEMPLTKIAAENFTVFEDIKIPFCEGLNVLVGENGVGKTHIMKLAYAARVTIFTVRWMKMV